MRFLGDSSKTESERISAIRNNHLESLKETKKTDEAKFTEKLMEPGNVWQYFSENLGIEDFHKDSSYVSIYAKLRHEYFVIKFQQILGVAVQQSDSTIEFVKRRGKNVRLTPDLIMEINGEIAIVEVTVTNSSADSAIVNKLSKYEDLVKSIEDRAVMTRKFGSGLLVKNYLVLVIDMENEKFVQNGNAVEGLDIQLKSSISEMCSVEETIRNHPSSSIVFKRMKNLGDMTVASMQTLLEVFNFRSEIALKVKIADINWNICMTPGQREMQTWSNTCRHWKKTKT